MSGNKYIESILINQVIIKQQTVFMSFEKIKGVAMNCIFLWCAPLLIIDSKFLVFYITMNHCLTSDAHAHQAPKQLREAIKL